MTAAPSFAALRCACGSGELMSVRPGQNGESVELLGQDVPVRSPVADKAWCHACWLAEFSCVSVGSLDRAETDHAGNTVNKKRRNRDRAQE